MRGDVYPEAHSDKVRLVTDFTKLNKRVKRSVHGLATAKQIRERFKSSFFLHIVK